MNTQHIYLAVKNGNTFGQGFSIDEARKNGNINGSDTHFVYTLSHTEFTVNPLTGGVVFASNNNPIVEVEQYVNGIYKRLKH